MSFYKINRFTGDIELVLPKGMKRDSLAPVTIKSTESSEKGGNKLFDLFGK